MSNLVLEMPFGDDPLLNREIDVPRISQTSIPAVRENARPPDRFTIQLSPVDVADGIDVGTGAEVPAVENGLPGIGRRNDDVGFPDGCFPIPRKLDVPRDAPPKALIPSTKRFARSSERPTTQTFSISRT